MPRRMPAAERDALYAKVVQLRRAKTPWDQIGKHIDRTAARAHQIYQEALTHNPLTSIQVDEHRVEATEIADLAVQHLMLIATSSSVTARTRVEAWSAMRGWEERRAKLLGTDAPTRHEVVTLDALDAQIRELEAELGARADVEGSVDVFGADLERFETGVAGGDSSRAAPSAAGTAG